MAKKRGLKVILASLLVTTALAAPAAVLSRDAGDVDAELYFSGVSLEMLPNGTIQAIFEVSVDKVINCEGATFILDYNPDYFTPSYIDNTTHERNEAFTATTNPTDDGFFDYDRTLYKSDVSPFRTEVEYNGTPVYDAELDEWVKPTAKYSTVILGEHRIIMDLLIDQEKITETGKVGKLAVLDGVSLGGSMGDKGEKVHVINKYDTIDKTDNVTTPERVTLGKLSFQVKPERLDEIARYFPEADPPIKTEIAERKMDNMQTEDGKDVFTYLVRTADVEPGSVTTPEGREILDNWMVAVYKSLEEGNAMDLHYYREHGLQDPSNYAGPAKRYYELGVDPKQIMVVRPAEESVTINAYEGYTDNGWGDVAHALRRYSPMATVTYVDGTEENLVIPWGEAEEEYGYTVEVKGPEGDFLPVDLAANSPAYDPTGGVYRITQYVPGKNVHPIPITVTLTVTPIHLLDIQVEDEVLTYDLDHVVSQVLNPSDLKLPGQARLITDIVPGGVSMVMNIPGWTPEKGSWPRPTGSNTSTLMNALKEDSFSPTVTPPDAEENFDAATMPYWPDDNDNEAIGQDQYYRFLKKKNGQWIGEYTFHLAESLGGQVIAGFSKAQVNAAFPWLTVDEAQYIGETKTDTATNEVRFAVPDVLRQIVTDSSFTNAAEYTADYVSTVVGANGQPELTLSVKRAGTGLNEGSIFRVWLPNGQELGTGLTGVTVWPDTQMDVDDWFPGKTNGSYTETAQGSGADRYFHLTANPGDPETGVYPGERETLRRYINLGGWYYVAVCETPATRTWSDPIPVWVPPRPNEHLSDKVYNFVGENTELFHWAADPKYGNDLTHYVTLPRGTYTAVNEKGVRLYQVTVKDPNTEEETTAVMTAAEIQADPELKKIYLDEKNRPKPTTERYELPYSYNTTYDGSTGAQPGTLYSFQLGPDSPTYKVSDPWTAQPDGVTDAEATPPGAAIYRYGPTPFFNGAIYPSFGQVSQPAGKDYTATVRRDETHPKTGNVRITLTSDSPTGITREDPNDMGSNVTLATYDTRTVGYTDRQPYTFTITNVGTEPIYGLGIDGLTDGYVEDPTGGRFVLLQAPADFLAPGQSTTFVMTYVYNLEPNGGLVPPIYRDTLYITCSEHPNGGKGNRDQDDPDADGSFDYLLDFDARFDVTRDDTYTVTVLVNPSDVPNGSTGPMGSGGLIVGPQGSTMNYTVTTRAYYADAWVYVAVYMKDEYTLVTDPPTVVDAAGNPVIGVQDFTETGKKDVLVYGFQMPPADATVTITFREDPFSKLRLSDLIDFSAPTQGELKPNTDPVAEPNTYKVWRKSFTDAERNAAKAWAAAHAGKSPEDDLYLMTAGTAVRKEDGGNQFISGENQYIVVIPYEADFSQVEAKLRALATDVSGDTATAGVNQDIKPNVVMHHYGKDIRDTWDTTLDVADVVYTGTGDTAIPTVHTSQIFDSPEHGTSNYVRITLSLNDVRRSYYLEIHRAPKNPKATLNYGNSPYGMIMNDARLKSVGAQESTKTKFKENGYTFNGLKSQEMPHVVSQANPAVSPEAVYWREAWVHNTTLFEPESLTGFDITYTTEENRLIPVATPNPGVYKESENLDLNDWAFFAILGENMKDPGVAQAVDAVGNPIPGLSQAEDSTGRQVPLDDIRVRVKVTLLDTDATTQIGRFSGAETVYLDMGKTGDLLGGLPQPAVMNAAQAGKWPVMSETTKDETTEEETTTYTQVENIRPGQYEMEYYYSDYNGDELVVTRPFVILPSVGDVDAGGGLVDLDDEAKLKDRVREPLGYVAGKWEKNSGTGLWEETVYPRANIFKYRVVDVNNDRNVNNIDGNLLHKIATKKAKAIRFYNPTDYVYTGGA